MNPDDLVLLISPQQEHDLKLVARAMIAGRSLFAQAWAEEGTQRKAAAALGITLGALRWRLRKKR